MEEPYKVSKILKRFSQFRYQLILESVLVGLLAGLVVVAFRLMLEQMEHLLDWLPGFMAGHSWMIPLWLVILVAAALGVTLLLKWEPMISGSGIPQLDGEIQGFFSQNWLRVLVAKFAGGLLSIGSGLSLGREGPSIQLGAMVAKGVSRVTGRMRTEERLLMTCGASAGLAAAFNAPLAGALFALEEVHKNFSVEVLLSAMASSVTADFVSRNVFGLKPVFDFSNAVAIPLNHFWIVLLLGVLLGLFGVVYNKSIEWAQRLYDKIPKQFFRTLIPFALAGIMLFFCPAVMGGGNRLVMTVAGGIPLGTLAVLFLLKFCFSALSFGSGVPGGIFLPMLVMGAMVGGLFHGVASACGIELNLLALVILGMAAAFSAIVRAPVTGILLITEMTGDFSHLLFLAMASLAAYVVADMLKSRPVYDQLLRRMLWKQGKLHGRETGEKVLIETTVCLGSPICGKRVEEVNLPNRCLIISVTRGDAEIVPRGDTTLHEGDLLVILCDEFDSAAVTYAMNKQCKETVPEPR